MKIRTMEKYIRYTALPYTQLLERATKGGLTVKIGKTITIKDSLNYTIELFPHNDKDINEGMAFISYNYPRT